MVAEQEEAKGTDENKMGTRRESSNVSDTPKVEKGQGKERAGRWLRGGNPNACPLMM